MSDALAEFGTAFLISIFLAGYTFLLTGYADIHTYGGFQDCNADQVEINKFAGSSCINYQSNLDLVLERMQKIDLPASYMQIAEITPGLTEKQVKAILQRYQEETGNAYTDGWREWQLIQNTTEVKQ